MSNLLSTLLSSAGALSAYDQVLAVTQNNVANALYSGIRQAEAVAAGDAVRPEYGVDRRGAGW